MATNRGKNEQRTPFSKFSLKNDTRPRNDRNVVRRQVGTVGLFCI